MRNSLPTLAPPPSRSHQRARCLAVALEAPETPTWILHALLALTVVAAVLTAAVPPASADWLVTQDGERLETAGPWQIKGRLVVFENPSGVLTSLRLSRVDLEASREATANARTRPAPSAQRSEESRPVLVLTDEDVGRFQGTTATYSGFGTPAPAAAEPGKTKSPEQVKQEEASKEVKPAPARLVVTEHREAGLESSNEGVVIVGRLHNNSTETATQIKLTASVYAEGEKEALHTADATLSASNLKPGQRTNFRVSFPGVFSFDSIHFETDSLSFQSAPPVEAGIPQSR